ncbi:MAG: Endolytic murein transglycosylase [candidate division WS2 bacterium]|nr:Endolytic murein transglycosylase [Candidatus Lithacetigena glycinireducens]
MKKILSIKQIKYWLLIVFVLVFFTFFLFKGKEIYSIYFSTNRSTEEIVFFISREDTVPMIAQNLVDMKIISNSKKFINYLVQSKKDRIVQAGEFILYKGMSNKEVVDIITSKDAVKKYRFTIIEGHSVKDVSRTLEKINLINEQEFTELNIHSFTLPFLLETPSTLEGFLFPDTYIIPRVGINEIISIILSNFKEKVASLVNDSPVVKELGFYNALILASIVEKEARVEWERPIIASVFYNRLKIGMFLQSCATVNYVLKEPKERLTYEDLAINSPYNTYLHAGLPPTPIANPGLSSIKAALYPSNTSYLYFVHKGDGTHEFSRTFEEHNQAKRKYLNP